MGEIINLQFGQTGNRIGDKFWSLLRDEHCLDPTGVLKTNAPASTAKIGGFFHEQKENKYVPRALLVDLDPNELDFIKTTQQHFYRPDNYLGGPTSAGNNWAKGHYTEGAELAEQLMDVVRAEVERSDCLHGFQIIHSMAGGTGSGMGSLILSKLREDYPDQMIWTYSASGSNRGDEAVVAPYNQVLTMNYLIENADAVVYLDDDAAYSISWKYLIAQPTNDHVNTLWANVISNITSGMRFTSQPHTNLRKLSLNLAPFKRAHFLVPATSPILAETLENRFDITTLEKTITPLFNMDSLILNNEHKKYGKNLTASYIFRGDITSGEFCDRIALMQSKQSSTFIEWIPDSIKTSICSKSPVNLNMSGTALFNTTTINNNFKFTADRFNMMFRRRAFLMWYCGEGMDEMEFREAISNLESLMADYQRYQDAPTTSTFAYPSDDEVD